MNALFTGIYSRFKAAPANTFYTALGGRMYLKRAPQRVAYPYCVYFMVSDNTDWTFTQDFDEVQIQFNVFSENNSASEAGTLLSKCRSLYDDCALSVTGYTHVYMQCTGVYELNDIDRELYGYAIQYDVLLES